MNEIQLRQPPKAHEDMHHQVLSMLEGNIIRKSQSYCSPVLLVNKMNGKKLFCIDFRKLNDVTVSDAYPTPRIEEGINDLGPSKIMSTPWTLPVGTGKFG